MNDFDQLHEELKKYNTDDVYVVGGEAIYRALLPECKVAYVTKINFAYHADAYFPNLDEHPDWVRTSASEEQTCFDLEYFYYKYEKKQ